MKRLLLVAALSLGLVGCASDGRKDADGEIYDMILKFQREHTKAGTCESRALYRDEIRLPYTMWLCVD